MLIFLDSGVVELLIAPKGGEASQQCRAWFNALRGDHPFVIPGIVHYERRRALDFAVRRGHRQAHLRNYDVLYDSVEHANITQGHLDLASELWAEARARGVKTAPDGALDIDMILCAQVRATAGESDYAVATTNVRHLAPFVDARFWKDVTP